jgi:hypothetical protein
MGTTGIRPPWCEAVIHLHIVLMSRAVELYSHSPYISMAWSLIDKAQGQIYHSVLPFEDRVTGRQ